jgi:uncharacterized membrane protein
MRFRDWLILLLILVLFWFGTSWLHEKQHQQIFGDYNISSTIRLFWGGLVTVPESKVLSRDDWRSMTSAQEEVDSIKYNLALIEILLGMIFSFIYVRHKEEQLTHL